MRMDPKINNFNSNKILTIEIMSKHNIMLKKLKKN